MEIEKLIEELKKYINGNRYNHSIAVMEMCEKLSQKYNTDVEKTKKAGLMHDLAKELSEESKLLYIKENNIEINDVEKANIDLTHGKIAADICKKNYGFDDEMCDAIKFHTTGKENMTMLQKIVFIADKCDETREYEAAQELRTKALIDIDQAIIENIDYTIKKQIELNRPILEKSIETRNFILINTKK